MSEFDPYLNWLGIRATSRPLNHYRLLGLDLYEDDPGLISLAVDRQMRQVREHQSGPYGDVSQQVLEELSQARHCLLMPDRKAEYDGRLSESMSLVGPASMTGSPRQADPGLTADVITVPALGHTPTPVVQPMFVPSRNDMNLPLTEFVDPGSLPAIGIRTDSTARVKTKRRESKQLAWSILGWISGGLAAVGVAAALMGSGLVGHIKPTGIGHTTSAAGIKEPTGISREPLQPNFEGTLGIAASEFHPSSADPPPKPVRPAVKTVERPSGSIFPDSFVDDPPESDPLAPDPGRRATENDSTNRYRTMENEARSLEKLKDAGVKARRTLALNPDDQTANLDQGDFLFVMHDDLDGALKHWVKSGDPQLNELAKLEFRVDDSNGSQIVELADAWWEFGRFNRTLRDRTSLKRAASLYEKARRMLAGLEKQAVEWKLNQLQETAPD